MHCRASDGWRFGWPRQRERPSDFSLRASPRHRPGCATLRISGPAAPLYACHCPPEILALGASVSLRYLY
jgi:hypothetical protein